MTPDIYPVVVHRTERVAYSGSGGAGPDSTYVGLSAVSLGDEEKRSVPLLGGQYQGKIRISNSLGSFESEMSSEPERASSV